MKQEKYYDSSIYCLRYIIQLDPEYGQAYMKLGNVYHLDKHRVDSAKIYYNKAMGVYNNVLPRDNRMMAAYYFLGEVYKAESKYDSAINYYNQFLKEIEPSDMYTKNASLNATYKALYECYQYAANSRLQQLLAFSKNRIAKDSNNSNLLLETLEATLMTIERDSVYEKYALPLARYIQRIPSADFYAKTFAVDDEFLILKKLGRNAEAIKVVESYHLKNPTEPLMLFELGRMKIIANNYSSGLTHLSNAKKNLNTIFTKQAFVDQLNDPDFNKVRKMPDFKKLIE